MYILDCTLRDGGYYNSWNFPTNVVNRYLEAMTAAGVDIVELGLRSLINKGFSGANAYTTDTYLRTLAIPENLKVAVMINATEIVNKPSMESVLEQLFPIDAQQSPVEIVRIACHVHEFIEALNACQWLKNRGYTVGYNLMQVADRSREEVEALALEASKHPVDVLYFADSMGGMNPEQTSEIIGWFRQHWQGAMGIHTHDNMGLALANTRQSIKEGITWLDSTVTGMGRGPGNARTEELVIEVAELRNIKINMVPLMGIIHDYFQPLKNQCGWGSNPYYYLSGKYGIHPTYIQEMLSDARYTVEDIISAIEQLKVEGGKKFNFNTLGASRDFYKSKPTGSWNPKQMFQGKDVLLLGTGPGVAEHQNAIEQYIKNKKPVVVALNTQSAVEQELIDVRVACHPTRLLADCEKHMKLPQPLITPASMLPEDILSALQGKEILDYGIEIQADTYKFNDFYSTIPVSLVLCYALATITAGGANKVMMAGFDGYEGDDPRTKEIQKIISLYQQAVPKNNLFAITPTVYNIPMLSVYAL